MTWQPLRRSARRDAAPRRADVADVDVIGGDGQIARHVQFVSPADHDAVESRDGGLADVAELVVHLDERAHPLPIGVGVTEAAVGLLFHVAPVQRICTRPGDDHHADRAIHDASSTRGSTPHGEVHTSARPGGSE